jgi:hypothetical protein
MQYILGAAGQNAANAGVLEPGADRGEYLGAVSRAWAELDPDDYSFTRTVADQMREHDDRAEFLAGILSSSRASPPSTRLEESTYEVRAVDL